MPDIGNRISQAQARKNLKPLIESIEEFIDLHKQVDSQQYADDDGHNPYDNMRQRLESLVSKLTDL